MSVAPETLLESQIRVESLNFKSLTSLIFDFFNSSTSSIFDFFKLQLSTSILQFSTSILRIPEIFGFLNPLSQWK
jgi:hypothetical protein